MPASIRVTPRFKTVQKLQLDYAPVKITQYESTRTGMRIAVVDKKGPKVEGEFALATEIIDDSGAPHTLEHLVFTGSKSYKYFGLLDRLSSRAFSTTNAGTGTDYTSYSLKTAGWEGFAQILPVYLEHLVVPTITDAACYTEVHHIDGTGYDAGVVYSEMQARENSSSDLMELHRRRMMYPEGNGLRSETGGMTKELRSLTVDRIRAYHKEMYQPKNLRVIITGEIDHDELLQILDDFETTIVDDVPKLDDPFKRPWVTSKPTPRLTENKVGIIQFPEEDESMGEITVGWLGPKCDDSLAVASVNILLAYLADSSISVLENTLVEREQLCSGVYYEVDIGPDVAVWLDLSSVETDRLRPVYERLLAVLKDVSEKPLDMNYMSQCIKRDRRSTKERAESSEDFFTQPLIGDHSFGARDGRDLKHLESLVELDTLATWSEKQWKEALLQYFVDNKHVCVLGVPSKELSDKSTKQEEARIEAQKKRLGPDGLKQLSKRLEEAKAENQKTIPDELLSQFELPKPENVRFIDTITARSGAARKMGKLDNKIQSIIDADDDGSPLFIHFEHIPSNFVNIKLYMGTTALPVELRPVLMLYLNNFFTTPVYIDGKRVEFEDFVTELEKDSITNSISPAYSNPQMLAISIKTEPESYEKVIARIRTLLFDAIHDPVRLQASLTKILADVPASKRAGDSMVWSVNTMISSNHNALRRAMDTLTAALYLKHLRKLLKQDEQTVLNKLQSLCSALHRTENFRVVVTADIEKLPKPVAAWRKLTDGLDSSKSLLPLDDLTSTVSDVGKKPGSAAFVIPITAVDSSFIVLTALGPDSYEHPDLPSLSVAIAFLRATEGPLWTSIRGIGLAYGSSLRKSIGLGKLNFSIDRAPNAYKAYAAGKAEIEGYASGSKPLTKLAIEGAIGEMVYEMAEEASTMGYAADESFITQVIRGLPKDYSHRLLKQLSDVGIEDVRKAIEKWLVPLFKPESANMVVTCATGMADDLVKDFESVGFKVQQKKLEDFQDDYGLAEPEGEDDEEDEDEDEDDADLDDDEGSDGDDDE